MPLGSSDYYKAASDMLRHYSAVRATIMSLTLPICFGLLGLAYSGRAPDTSRVGIILIESTIFCFAIILSVYFSDLYEETKSYLISLESGKTQAFYSRLVVKKRRLISRLKQIDDLNKSLIAVGLFLHLVFIMKEIVPMFK